MLNSDGITASVSLHAQDGSITGYAIIDAADAEWIGRHRWFRSVDGYASRGGRKGEASHVRMHREVMAMAKGDRRFIDHINRDKLDNRRPNLRIVSATESAQNVSSQSGATSRYRGVYWDKKNQKWRAQVVVNGRAIALGRFTSEDEAAEVARSARIKAMPYAVD